MLLFGERHSLDGCPILLNQSFPSSCRYTLDGLYQTSYYCRGLGAMKLPLEHSLAAIREMYSTVKILCQAEKSKQILWEGENGHGKICHFGLFEIERQMAYNEAYKIHKF